MSQHQQRIEQIFVGDSEMAKLMRSHDWERTPIGAVSDWALSLKTAVSICLNSRFPMVIWWGKELVLLYNDAWQPILGTKHPKALGRPGHEVWSEIWDIIGVQLNSVLETAKATWSDDMLLLVDRYGFTEEAYFTYSYSPIFLETGAVGGAFTAVTETTRRVIGERRLSTLRELAANTVETKSVEETCRVASATLASNPYDIPFALLYLVEQEGKQARLVGTVGVEAGTCASPESVDLTQAGEGWKFARVKQTGEAEQIDQLITQFGALSGGAWNEPARSAIVLPIAQSGQKDLLAGLLVLGISPRLEFDDEYRGFFDLVASNVATAIANAQTYEAERERAEALAELDRAKTAFFSNVSHEFRTPLTLMLSPLEELSSSLDERLQPDEREQLHLMQRNGLRLQKLVNTLLDFSRIEAGRVQASYEPTDLATYTAELSSVFRSLIERAGMTLQIDCPTLPELVYVDREMWEKIVLNLISNAFKFTFTGSITVRLQPVGDSVELSVTDTGVGIPEAELPRLFERFHRISGTRSRTYEGSGIGLALVQELVKLHGGTISVTSQVDRGTTFTIALPFGCSHLPSERIQATRSLASSALGADPYVAEASRWISEVAVAPLPEGNMTAELTDATFPLSVSTQFNASPTSASRILLVDDNADMREYLKRLLSQQYEVEAVADGIAALNAIRRSMPDLVLSDVMMPNLDGFGLLRELRANSSTQEIPLILLSARAGEESRIEGLEAGADDYLIKPFSARELMARVEATLKLARIRQEAARAIRENEERLLFALRAARMVAWDWNLTTGISHRLGDTVEIFGLETDAADDFFQMIHPDDRATVKSTLDRAIRGEADYDLEFRLITSNGRTLWIADKARPRYDDAGQPTHLTGVCVDITARKQAEEALRQREAELREAQRVGNFGNWHWDAKTDVTTGSDQLLRIYGFDPERDTMPNFTDQDGWLYPHESWQRINEEVQRALETGIGYELDVQAFRNGTPIWITTRSEVLHDSTGTIVGLRGTVQEITARKQAEEKLSKSEEQLRVLLAREQAAREAAESANRVKDEFLAVLSHELRSPLNPILGWSKLLQQGKLDATRTRDALSTIARNAQLQAQLINDLLDISRILRGKLSLNTERVDLNPVIAAALETVRLAAEAKSLQVQTKLLPTLGTVMGDAGRLQQVVWNLLSNAVKFTPQGGQITIALTDAGTHAQIQVTDTGKGINPEFLPYVFEHFRQEDAATTRKFGGLGLGLAIARQIVELHGGQISAGSLGEGQGATFTVLIPLAPSLSQFSASEPAFAATEDLRGLHILVVDDESDSRDFIAFVLEQAGAIVTSVPSGIEAIQQIEQMTFNLVVSDIGMPEMDGYMLMQQIRLLEQEHSIPAIALTAYAGEFDRVAAIKAGFNQHLPKPVDPEQLIAAIASLI